MADFFMPHQIEAISKMRNGCILNGSVGSGKTRTGLGYYYIQQGGRIEGSEIYPMVHPKDLYIITTAMKRDLMDFEQEMLPFCMSPDNGLYDYKVKVDSWQNIEKYQKVKDAFFIFDEDRITGHGVWVKAFLDIAKNNEWIVLSATPGDTWEQYIPVFLANGFYKNKSEFIRDHVVWCRGVTYPKIDRYLNIERLERLRNRILIDMEVNRHTVPHHEDIYAEYDTRLYKDTMKTRWDPYKCEPFKQASDLCYGLRRIVNSDVSRQVLLLEIFEKHPKMIVFYSFDYELDILKNLYYGENVEIAEWNGHKHQPVPTSDSWVYFVNYTAGAEGWNCITTDTIVFYSQTYSWKTLAQACGRIDRLNTPFIDLYYYHIKSRASIDISISRALTNKKLFNVRKFSKWDKPRN